MPATVPPPPAISGTAIPGKYAISVDSSVLDGNLRVAGVCKDVTYGLNMRAPFETAIRARLSQLLEETEIVPVPLTPAELQAAGYDGQVAVFSGDVAGATIVERPSMEVEAGIRVRLVLHSFMRSEDAGRSYNNRRIDTEATAENDAFLDICESLGAALDTAFAQALDGLVRQLDAELAPLRAAKAGLNS